MNTFTPSDALSRIAPSPTMAITQKARELRAQGRDILSLSAGEPDFDTPQHVRDAAIAAINAGETHYTASDGTPQLKAAVIEKFKRDNGADFAPEEIVATSGGKFLIYAAMMATLNAGDEVIIPAPYWVSYPDIVRLAGATPRIVSTTAESSFVPDADAIAQAITPRTKWLFLNSPNNPTGAIIDRPALEAIAEVLRAHPHVWVLSDEIYELIDYSGDFTSFATVAPELKERTLIVNGASKGYAMTGWRLGIGAGPVPLMKAVTKLLGQTTSNPCSITQAAGAAAFAGDHSFITAWRATYKKRRDALLASIEATPGLSCATPPGAFYAFVSCDGWIGRTYQGQVLQSDQDVAAALLDGPGVATVPGSAFGLAPYLRLSYATADDVLAAAGERLLAFAQSLG